MFKGLRTVVYKVDDLDAAKKWYGDLFGVQPYFDQPFYVGFNIGGFELGLDPSSENIERGNYAVAYWGVENAAAAVERSVGLGATLREKLQDVGEGIVVASVDDPFGNVIGIIENPHFKYAEK
jgi:predicted enzyme related to lactoylglutathione lyase